MTAEMDTTMTAAAADDPLPRGRLDARQKATGATRYVADIPVEGALHAAVVRSPLPRAAVTGIDVSAARGTAGVVAVYTAADLPRALVGRRVVDIPLLAVDQVRFVGEPVAAVVAETRQAAEQGAERVEVSYEELPAVLSATAALAPGAPLVHREAWAYEGAVVRPSDGANLQSRVRRGSLVEVEAALAGARFTVDRSYSTPAMHQGYLEPQAWAARVTTDGEVWLWATNKSPYRLRDQVARPLGLAPERVHVQPVPLGGDFGGKGAPGLAPLCVELARLVERPVRITLRSGEDITATDARHPSIVRVRLGCDPAGRLVAASLEALFDGGAYAGSKPVPDVNLHGVADAFSAYRVPAAYVESTIAYTNSIPKGHMRSPGAPQATFALESALDEMALAAGVDPVALRRTNLVRTGEANAHGHTWVEARGEATLDAALGASQAIATPDGWLAGEGVAVYARSTPPPARTSLRLEASGDGTFDVEVPVPETGTGSHTVVQALVAEGLGVPLPAVRVRQVETATLPADPGVGASRVTVGMAAAVAELVAAWQARPDGDMTVAVETGPAEVSEVGSYCTQVARVAVDPVTGELRVLELVSAVDVAEVVNPAAHQMQIEGAAMMGIGSACLEDLLQEEGQIWAGTLGDLKLPTAADAPRLATVLLRGGKGYPPTNLKAVGELANVPTGAAVANAVAAATGQRIRALPLSAERVYQALHGGEAA